MKKIIASLALILILASCGKSEDNVTPDVVDDTNVKVVDNSTPVEDPEIQEEEKSGILDGGNWSLLGSEITLDFENARYVASAGCNTISGSYEALEDGTITFATGATTLMGCPEDVAATEADLIDTLADVAYYNLSDESLELIGEEKKLLLEKPQETSLEGNTWKLESLLEGNGVVSDRIFKDSVINFSEDGNISGTAICNNMIGSYRYDSESGAINISKIALTEKLCSGEDANKYEQAIVETLENSSRIIIEKNKLKLESDQRDFRITYGL